MKRSLRYLLHKLSYDRFCVKFCCHGNRGHPKVYLNDAIKLPISKNHTLEPKMTTLSCVQSEF